jgi:DNA-directed RNA polymerase specialized sigma24 family protein
MPEAAFRAQQAAGLNDAELAHAFGVSKSAVEIRRTVLG